MNVKQNKKTQFIELDLIDYTEAWDYQLGLFDKLLQTKAQNRGVAEHDQLITDNYLIFCEHPHVYTLGKSGKEQNLKISKDDLSSIQATYHQSNRGGDITYHGPGQIVGYPVIDMENFFTDIHKYMRLLEEAVIQTLVEYGIKAGRIPGMTGVWLDENDQDKARKICALGVKTSRWITMHGFAFNINTDLTYFNHIGPCGIEDKAVTSLEKELGRKRDMREVEHVLKGKIVEQFGMELI